MSEDEAFIRAIVDSPGDETPRLVYADWLDERDDPRGAYLRAEQDAYRTGQIAKVLHLAVGLDPVWVARVTCPPFGVCCEHIEFRNRGPIIDREDIKRFEQQCGMTLPPDYHAFLLNYNGGLVNEARYETPGGEVLPDRDHEFYSLKSSAATALESVWDWWVSSKERYRAEFGPDPRVENWFSGFLPVGDAPDVINGVLLGVAGPAFGRLRMFDYSLGFDPGFLDTVMESDAGSFADYLSLLPSPSFRSWTHADELPY
jgi:uncharacterized protein (TIGR02996 family)